MQDLHFAFPLNLDFKTYFSIIFSDSGDKNIIDCHIPIVANQTFTNVQLVGNTTTTHGVPYQMEMPLSLKRNTTYSIRYVIVTLDSPGLNFFLVFLTNLMDTVKK